MARPPSPRLEELTAFIAGVFGEDATPAECAAAVERLDCHGWSRPDAVCEDCTPELLVRGGPAAAAVRDCVLARSLSQREAAPVMKPRHRALLLAEVERRRAGPGGGGALAAAAAGGDGGGGEGGEEAGRVVRGAVGARAQGAGAHGKGTTTGTESSDTGVAVKARAREQEELPAGVERVVFMGAPADAAEAAFAAVHAHDAVELGVLWRRAASELRVAREPLRWGSLLHAASAAGALACAEFLLRRTGGASNFPITAEDKYGMTPADVACQAWTGAAELKDVVAGFMRSLVRGVRVVPDTERVVHLKVRRAEDVRAMDPVGEAGEERRKSWFAAVAAAARGGDGLAEEGLQEEAAARDGAAEGVLPAPASV